ncbi:hypothetical protein [Dactylosporangium sp. NPDC051484]|uniref:hypothetical protein n=1 Tax=Dactylosporangium sp. NPDC051484 TaxID=3154942 RepID=UPI00344C7CFF
MLKVGVVGADLDCPGFQVEALAFVCGPLSSLRGLLGRPTHGLLLPNVRRLRVLLARTCCACAR